MSERSAEVHRRQLHDVNELAEEAVLTLMETLSSYPLKDWAQLLRELLPEIVETYGAISGELAIQYYNLRRRELLIKKKEDDKKANRKAKKVEAFEATTSMIPTAKILENLGKSVDRVVGKVFFGINEGKLEIMPDTEPEMFEVLTRTEREKITQEIKEIVSRDVMNHSRETLAKVAKEDPAPIKAIRRVDADGCEWCKLLWHRGYIAGKFHKGCECKVDLDLDGKVIKPAWADEWLSQYRDAVGSSTDASTIVVAMRKQNQEAANASKD